MMTFEQGELVVYQSEDGQAAVDVRLKDETVWLSQAQLTELFSRDKRTVSEHIRNIFREGELQEKAVVRKFRTTAVDGKQYKTKYYNLDVIISVGYRVKSQHGTRFRIWATSILKDHLVKGYTLNQKRLAEKGLGEARQMLELLSSTIFHCSIERKIIGERRGNRHFRQRTRRGPCRDYRGGAADF